MIPRTIDQIVPLVSERKLAVILGVPLSALRELAALGDSLYRSYDLPKKRGAGIRKINDPRDRLKVVQRRIYVRLLQLIPLPPFILGGVPGKSVRDNAEPHVRAPWLVKVDIKRFFPSVNARNVSNVWLRYFRTGRNTTAVLTRLTTFSGQLPQGAPTSTPLANLVLAPVLDEFQIYLSQRGLALTDWVDDITFSGSSAPDAINRLADILSQHGFRIARSKTQAMHAGGHQETTGVVTNRKLSVGRNRKRRLRDTMRAINGRKENAREKGLIAHTLSISRSQGNRLKELVAKRRDA